MFTRQKILLRMVELVGGQITRLHLVKLAFLLAPNIPAKVKFYQFLPYKHGPFSFNLYHELDQIIQSGLLSSNNQDSQTLQLSDQYGKVPLSLDYEQDIAVKHLLDRYEEFPLSELIEDIYKRYPWYTLNSEQPARRRAHLPAARRAIYTMGYEGWQVDGFLNHLLECGIRQLIDTRNNPVSRSYGFHKKTLERLCQLVAIDYFHLPRLGIPPSLRKDLQTYQDYQILFSTYENQLAESDLKHVSALMKEKPSVLMCVEKDQKFCHRGRLAAKLKLTSDLAIVNL